jgi:uncharacterized protein
MSKTILITGASGLVGNRLAKLLSENNYIVHSLSRKPISTSYCRAFKWDYHSGYIEEDALNGVDIIIHLAGENIGEGRWTEKKKKSIIDSRVKTAELLYDTIKDKKNKPSVFISASAVGYYESYSDQSPEITESSPPGSGFTSKVCELWEQSADNFKKFGMRVTKIRTGLVQDKDDPALKKILLAAKFGILPILGKGKQYYPWIHIEDLAMIYLFAAENKMAPEIINAVAPEIITQSEYVKFLKQIKYKNHIKIKIPSRLIKIAFGQKSEIILKGGRIKSVLEKSVYFSFDMPKIKLALKDIILKQG